MFKKFIFFVPLFAILSACGGASTSGTSSSFTNHSEVLKTFVDGSGIAVATEVPGSALGSFNVTMLLGNTSSANQIVDALKLANTSDPKLALISSSINPPYYQQQIGGTNAINESVVLIFAGETLPSGGFVSNSIITAGTGAAVSTDGSRLVSLPSGTFNYTGSSSITGGISGDEIEDGTFNMQANFTAMTADISAQTTNKYFTGSNLTINSTNGKFQGNGTIGITSVNSTISTVVGYFAGNQAEGVHGATYQNADVPTGMAGVFYGSR